MHLYQILKLFYVINTENFTEKFNRQSKLGFDSEKEFKMHFVLLFYLNKVINFFRLTFNESRVVF
ncbi:hypothetical protein EGM72_03535 [Staphylococcus epidermidis]|nr:hypothetical protein [Staphylococcus epidermidis]RNM21066.1 hypothetical protein EFY84_09350 [Staphylococcus epidermidis]